MEKTELKDTLVKYGKIAIKFFLIFWLFYFIFRQFTE
jgi:hypothetical protein